MAQFGIDTRSVHEQIICNNFNDNSAVCRLLLKRKTAKDVVDIIEASHSAGAPAKPARTPRSPPRINDAIPSAGTEPIPARTPARLPLISPGSEVPKAPRILATAVWVVTQRRISRPMAARTTLDVSTPTVSHEIPA
jgi:hypothetical protein